MKGSKDGIHPNMLRNLRGRVQSITNVMSPASAEAQLTSSSLFSCICFGNQITVIFNTRQGCIWTGFVLTETQMLTPEQQPSAGCLLPLMQMRSILTMKGEKTHVLELWGDFRLAESVFWDPVTHRDISGGAAHFWPPEHHIFLYPNTLSRHLFWC